MSNQTPRRKKIVLCADDYGQSAAISAGIAQLVEQRRLSAVSCMTEAPFWNSADNALPPRHDIDIGLHFNLTHPFAGQTPPARPLARQLRDALLGRLDTRVLERALHSQLDRFEAVLGRAPDFVDGHQHVHVFPQVRGCLLSVLEARYSAAKPWLRAVDPALEWRNGVFKLGILKMLGAGFGAAARRRGFAMNRRFAGIYSLQPQADFAALMQHWLDQSQDGTLIMCHPGLAADDPADEIAATRPLELALLGSERFGAMLARANVELARLRDLQR